MTKLPKPNHIAAIQKWFFAHPGAELFAFNRHWTMNAFNARLAALRMGVA